MSNSVKNESPSPVENNKSFDEDEHFFKMFFKQEQRDSHENSKLRLESCMDPEIPYNKSQADIPYNLSMVNSGEQSSKSTHSYTSNHLKEGEKAS